MPIDSMSRTGPVAVQGNGRLDDQPTKSSDQHHTHDANKIASQYHDITPEVFRRFMTYERIPVSKQLSLSTSYADPSSTPSSMEPGLLTSASSSDAPTHVQGTVQRRIRAMPKRRPNAPETLASAADDPSTHSQPRSQEQAVPPRIIADAVGSGEPISASPRTSDHSSTSMKPHSDANNASSVTLQTLSGHFQHLRLSSQAQTPASESMTSIASPGEASDAAHNRSSNSTSHFRFPSLPAKLTDDSFHYRQRAAQFILLYSQQVGPENLSKYNRLSSPLSYGSRDPTSFFTPDSCNRHSVGHHGANLHNLEGSSCSATLDDDESFHSHHHVQNPSDDESEYLDFDACRTAHLGNKKKRKSSRFSSPGHPILGSVSSLDNTLQTGAIHLSAQETSARQSNPTSAYNQAMDCALVDKTNTFRQTASQNSAPYEAKQNGEFTASSGRSLAPRHTYVRLPPRKASNERKRAALRDRIRARLVPIFQQRRLDRIQDRAREKQEQQAKREAQEAQARAEADAQGSTMPEKRAPPKRASKAGKRAQAIRGGNSPVKPLTIAEIRARATAASGGSQSGSVASPEKTNALSPQPQNAPPRPQKGHVESDRTAAKRGIKIPLLPSPERDHAGLDSSSTADGSAKRLVPPIEPDNANATRVSPLCPKLLPPTSSFDFRMSSAVTLRLRELRSQLDAATRNLADASRHGDTHAAAQALSEAVAAPPPAPVPTSDSRRIESTNTSTRHGDGLPVDVPPWVRHALEFQHQLEQQQMMDTKTRHVRQSVKSYPGAVSAPLPPPVTPSQARSGSSTPAQQGKHQSSATPSKSTSTPPSRSKGKTVNGRRTASRRSAESAHHHGASCKHGHAHGHGRKHETGSALFTDDDWICVFCEYELYYGEAPLMLRACRNRKKLVEKKSKAKTKAQAAIQKKSSVKTSASGCQHHHDHDHDHDHHHGCEHEHEHACHHDHSSTCGSDDYPHDHHHHYHQHDHGNGHARRLRQRPQSQGHDHGVDDDAHRERCDCGNSIHSSDFDDEDK